MAKRKCVRLTKDQIAEIPTLYQSGLSLVEIAGKFDVSDVAIGNWMKKLGVPVKPGGQFQPVPLDTNSVVDLYASGLSTDKIGLQLGVSRATIERRLQDVGVAIHGATLDLDNAAITKAYLTGQTASEIAEIQKCSGRTILSRLQQQDVKPRRIGPRFAIQGLVGDTVKHMYTSGQTTTQISKHLKFPVATISAFLHRRKINMRRCGRSAFRKSTTYGYTVGFGSGWEESVYSALVASTHLDTFLYQGECERMHRRADMIELRKPPEVAAIYGKRSTYRWFPDFILPDEKMILEVKGNYWAKLHWERVVLPCIKASLDLIPYSIYVLYEEPSSTWEDIRSTLIRLV